MAWWKYEPLKVQPMHRYTAEIRGWPAVLGAVGSCLAVAGYAWEDEVGRSAWSVAGMVAGVVITLLGVFLDDIRDSIFVRGARARFRAGRTPPRG